MKKVIAVAAALLLMLVLLPSCSSGVPKEDYDKAQAQIQSLQADLSKKDGDLKTAQTKITQAKAKMEIVNTLFVPALKGEQLTQAQQVDLFFKWRDKVTALGDADLSSKFQVIIDNASNSQKMSQAMKDFFLYLFESLPKGLE